MNNLAVIDLLNTTLKFILNINETNNKYLL